MINSRCYQSETAKTIYSIKTKKYNIIVQRYLLEKPICLSDKSLYKNKKMGFSSRKVKSTVPIYSICIDELKVIRKNRVKVEDFIIGKGNITIRCVGFNGKDAIVFFCCRHLRSLLRLLSTRSRFYINRLKGIIGSDFYDYPDRIIGLLKLLSKVSKYDVDRIMSVIRHDYYKTLRDHHRLIL